MRSPQPCGLFRLCCTPTFPVLENPAPTADPAVPPVLSCGELRLPPITQLMRKYGLALVLQPANGPIPGSYWGNPEAGLIGRQLFVREDTPVHSALHEACHWICMDDRRRKKLHTDAGGDYAEENAVCYLQILLADQLPGFGRVRMLADMDSWGYSFRLGSSTAWYEQDADDAMRWLLEQGLIDELGQPTWRVRR